MARHLEWYLVELERKLDRVMGAEDTHTLLMQAEDHIWSIKEELLNAGMDELKAEQAAVQRFGRLENLTGTEPVRQRRKRANWTAPLLVLLGSMGILGAALVVGTYNSILIAAVLSVIGLIVAALLCARRGAFPGLMFGITMILGMSGLSYIAADKFMGYDTGFIRKGDAKKLENALLKHQAEELNLTKVAEKAERIFADQEGAVSPEIIQDAKGYAIPEYWYAYQSPMRFALGLPVSSASNMILNSGRRLGHTQDFMEAYTAWDQYFKVRVHDWSESYREQWYANALAAVRQKQQFESDTLFAGIGIGSGITAIWMLIAFLFNRLASFEMPTTKATHRRRRVA